MALCIEHPLFTSWYYQNPAFPIAVKYAYYSCCLRKVMGSGYNKTSGCDFVQHMYSASQMCGYQFTDAGNCSAMNIICQVFACEDCADCFPVCPSEEGINTGLNYANNIIGQSSTFGMAGGMVGGVPGAVIGAGIGALLGGFTANAKEKAAKKKCQAIRSQCYLPPGESYSC